MDELEELRQQRLQELQSRLAQEIPEQQAQEKQKQLLLRKLLSLEARERLGRLRLANPRLAERAESAIFYLYQAGQLAQPLQDSSFKIMLEKLTQKRETKIVRK